MTAPDLHPEELLDRAASGALSVDERARLDAHLAVCPACRFELQARADFAALPDVAPQVDDLVTRALAGLPQRAPPVRRRPPVAMVAATLVLVGFSSLAALRLAPALAAMLGLSRPVSVAPSPPPAVAPVARRPARPPPEAGLPPPEAPASDDAPQRVVGVEPPLNEHAAGPQRKSPPPLSPSPTPTTQPPLPLISVPVTVDEQPTADALFRAATRARTGGNREEAERLYRELAARFPASEQAVVAHAVLGRLLLDLGRPAEGLRELEATLDGGPSALREDALAHRALALDAMNDPRAGAAWGQLLAEFPESIHARRARERLEALSPP
ncbi:MAG: zf-HC2 domain-containing protein [Myxococcaceae bacterium]|jgi:hypothetical protein|nr:zf-HC2 domain-containing protein [Myxococcaceae bacterium]MCA3011057.1 zf-HC2 domain-containing protein [Myxococcaceae bacterium]